MMDMYLYAPSVLSTVTATLLHITLYKLLFIEMSVSLFVLTTFVSFSINFSYACLVSALHSFGRSIVLMPI
jgi:hypothetical protein